MTTTNHNNNKTQDNHNGLAPKFHEHKSWSDRISILAHWIVDIFALPASFAAAILAQFVEPGTPGAKILGFMGFVLGTMFGADGVWQLLFQGTPLFPFFETQWIGWKGWLTLPFNLLFWISIGIGALVQIMESKTLRSKSPEKAKREFEEAQKYTLPQQPKNSIDYTRALWGDYKRAGMRERNSGGLISAFFWIFDIVTTFGSRWPFRYTNPAMILGALAYNAFTMFAGETGYAIWKQVKR